MKDILIHSNHKNINFSLKELQNNNINNDDLLIGIYEDKYSIKDKKSKKLVSKLEYNLFILYDIQSENIFLINKKDIINRVISFNYRFPDLLLIETLKNKLNKLTNKTNQTNQTNSIKVNKINKIFNFLKNFDINILEKNFIKEFEKINNSKYKEYTTCLRQSYTNILPNTYYIKPYFNLSELEKNYINNSDLDDTNTNTTNTNTDLDEYDLCNKTLLRDIPISTLNLHQQYINNNSSTSVIQYYSLIGSYILNNYLRELTENAKYKNEIIENLIKKLWNTIINAPVFDETFYIYRFLNNDDFLKKLEIGDIYIDDGFLSTTRDPFYISKYYSFGNKLMKIKVPKNQKGIGLCLELFSHFGREQEILLAPKTKLRLIKKDKDVKYEHINYDITIKLESKYEFEIVEISEVSDVEIKKKIDVKINKIDKLEILDNQESNTLEDIYNNIKEKYLNENNQVLYKIGNEYINLIIDKNIIYESYYIKPFYVGSDEQSTETVLIYHIKDNEIIFFIEINYNKETYENEINVNINNYYNYSDILTEDIFETKDFLLFLKNLSEVFNNNNNIAEIQILCDFISCNIFKNKKIDKLVDDYRDILSGNSNLEIYNYFKEDTIRFQDYILNNIIVPYFDYNKLDKYKKIKITDIIDEIESNELKEIINSYINNNKQYYVSTFYIYLAENYCFLVSELIYSLANYEYINFKDYDRSIFYNPYYVFFPNKLTSK